MKTDVEKLVIFNAAEDYWLQKLKGVTLNPVFGERKDPDKSSLKSFDCWHESFPTRLIHTLHTVSKNSDTNAFLIFIAAINILMYKYTGTTDILIGTPGYQDEEDADIHDVLLFFRTNIEGDSIPRDLINESLNELNDSYENHQYDYESFFKRFCNDKNGDPEALSASGLIYNKFSRESRWEEEIGLLFNIKEHDGGIDFFIKYNKGYYTPDQVAQLGRHYMNILASMMEDPDRPVHAIEMLTPEDKQEIAASFMGEQINYREEKETFLFCFESQVERTPQSTALVCENAALSYCQLNEIANQLARCLLKEVFLAADDLASIVMERSEKMVECILAVWKCGAAYIPIEPSYPEDRIETITKDSGAKLVITETGIIPPKLEKALESVTKIICLDKIENLQLNQDKTNLCKPVLPCNLAYVIYTSGSTGKPKGVMIEQRGMMNHLHAKIAGIQIDPGSVIAQNASHCFDISIWQLFAAHPPGGRTVIYPNRTVLNPGAFIKQLDQHGVNILEVVPSYLSVMLDLIEDQKMGHVFSKLKYLLVTGESVKPGLVKRWFEKFPAVKMVNAYGPTEASDDITHFIMDRYPGAGIVNIPIGRTLRNFRIYIVDAWMGLCPLQVKGEICVSGVGVGRGYLNDVEKTADAFIKDPFGGGQGVRMYRTGDIGRHLPDGNIEFFGRKDYQVKVRGYRIELEEIENRLSGLEGVRDAVVIEKESKRGDTYLCGYITLREDADKSVAEIKTELGKSLPDYMVPAFIIVLHALPLTPNGKVDRKALPEPGESGQEGTAYAPPRDAAEKKLVEIWRQVMDIEPIGIHDNFFSLGGNSLLGIRIVNKIQEWLQETVHVTILFLAPTVARLAAKLASYKIEKETRIGDAQIAEFRSLIQPLAPLPAHLTSPLKTPPVMFILCPSRSGSTLLRVILAGHPQLFAPQEFELLSFNTLPERKEALSGKFGLYLEGVIRAIMELKQMDADEAKAIMERYEAQGMSVREFYGILQSWLGERILVEKTPQYTYDINVLRRAEEYFDSPLYIQLVRNPYAVIHSYENARLDQLFKYDHHFSIRQLGELLWLICHQNILEFLETVPAARKFRLKYEDLVSSPAVVTAQMCRHFGLEFYPGMLDVYDDAGNRMTDGIYAESKMLGDVKFFTHSSIDTTSVEKWKEKYKTPFLGKTAAQLAAYFGYSWERTRYSKIKPTAARQHYELSPSQKRLWILDRLEENQIAYNVPGAYLVTGDLNSAVLKKSYETVVRRHEILRTTFITLDGTPRQKIHDFDSLGFKWEYIDLRNQQDREEKAKILAQEEAASPFHLERGPLLRTKTIRLRQNQYLFLFTMHHIISDGWSMQVLVKEILALYGAYEDNRENPLPPPQFQYRDYSDWLNGKVMRQVLEGQEKYWLDKFSGEVPLLNLPIDYPRPAIMSFVGATAGLGIDEAETDILTKVARSEGVSIFIVLAAVFTLFLAKLSGQEDIVIGTPTAGRHHPGLENILGMFVNTLALRSFPRGEMRFHEFLHQLRAAVWGAFENQDYPFETLVEKVAAKRDLGHHPLFDVMFSLRDNYEAAPGRSLPRQEMNRLEIKPYEAEHAISKFDLSFNAWEQDGSLYFSCEYCTRLFQEDTIRRFIGYFKNVVTAITRDPVTRISEIEIISTEEKDHILDVFNNTAAAYPADKTIHRLFEEQAENIPDRVALVGKEEGGKGRRVEGEREAAPDDSAVLPVQPVRHVQLTYRQLNERSDRLAHMLIEKGVHPDSIVGIMMERSVEMIIGILGILKSGGAYLPIEPDYPEERKQYMLKDSSAGVLVTTPKLQVKVKTEVEEKSRQPGLPLQFIHINTNLAFSSEPSLLTLTSTLTCRVSPANLAYIIYTSGSTGRPRGVMVEHRSVGRLIKNTNYIKFSPRDRLLPTGSSAFDITTFEIWGPLCNGVMLSLVSKEVILNTGKLKEVLVKHNISILHLIPPLFNQLAASDIELFAGLRCFLVGGDLVSPVYINALRREYTHLKILHMYGPTENTTFSTFLPVEREYEFRIPLGEPIANTTVYIVDKNGHLQPRGIIGELCVGGAGIARGYLNNPGLTAEKFNPLFYRSHRSSMSYIYRTGDLARWLSDGNIEFLGRIDTQVKIRGFRVEPGEIESRILKETGIKEAVVIDRANVNGDKYLCAYIVTDRKDEPGGLRDHLAKELPDYMIPSYFVRMEKLPVTANGKIDRKALPQPEGEGIGSEYTPPANEIEEKLTQIWERVLGIEKEKISTRQNFFVLGGTSLNLIKQLSLIYKELGIEVNANQIYQNPTIQAIARSLQTKKYYDTPVQLLNQPGKKKLFCFPPGSGFGIAYQALAKVLTDYSLYSFNFIENENRLNEYVENIIDLQPTGPYTLFGWSAAGKLAFAVAGALENQNRQVADIILIDSLLINYNNNTSQKEKIEEEEQEYLRAVQEFTEKAGLEFIKEKVIRKADTYLNYLRKTSAVEVIQAKVHLILSESNQNKSKTKIRCWDKLTGKPVLIYNGFGSHGDVFTPGPLEKNAEIIKKILGKSGSTGNNTPPGGKEQTFSERR